jgi:sigma-E factor negative regulatory protein RseB
MLSLAAAQGAPAAGDASSSMGPPERSVAEWLVRLQQAARVPSFVGTFVVTSATGAMSSARIWHVCEGDVEVERVEALSGVPRTIFRRNQSVVTFYPQTRLAVTDQREPGGAFPNLLTASSSASMTDHYAARELGQSRVAGYDTDVVYLKPRDDLRYGYRIWSERNSGLVLKTQTLDGHGRVLEQSAFSELQLNTPLQAAKLTRLMERTEGYKVEKPRRVQTTADAEGWALSSNLAGFSTQNCYRHNANQNGSMVQWIFSDGLATVSLFIEPFDASRHANEGAAAMGATHTLTKRLPDAVGAWWVTAVGEVPPATLKALVSRLHRKP